MEKTEITQKPARKPTRSRAKPKEKVIHKAPLVVEAKLEETISPQPSAEKIEDRISSIIIIAICLCFLAFVGYQTVLMNNKSGNNPIPQPGRSIVPISNGNYDCKKHTGDYTGCVNAQVTGKGCSWYSDCKACITGSHDGRTFEEMCGRSR